MDKYYLLFLNLPHDIQNYILSYGDTFTYQKHKKVLKEFLFIKDTWNECEENCNCTTNFIKFILRFNKGYLYDDCKSLNCYSIHDEIVCVKLHCHNHKKNLEFYTRKL